MAKPETMMIDNVKYIREDSVKSVKAEKLDGMEYCIVRTYSAGVHIGYVKEHNGITAVLFNSRRMWNWSKKAAELNQMAIEGCESKRFSMTVAKITVIGVIEIIPCSQKAKEILQSLEEWKC